MNKWIKRTGIGVLALTGCGAVALLAAAQYGERKMDRQITVSVPEIPYRTDTASVERGRYLFRSRGCVECHGANGAGKDVVNDGKGMLVHAPNITPSPDSVVAGYTTNDWTRTIRHGIKPNGRPAIVMPSEDYARFTDVDLASLVGYLRQMSPAPGGGAQIEFPLVVRALYGVGLVKDAAERINHALPASAPVPAAATPEHGAYVANSCLGCHGTALSGGAIPGAPPDWPAAANLTPGAGSALVRYVTAESFTAMFRSGKRPDGSAISSVMPFTSLKEMNDTDVQALYIYLKTLPARSTGQP